MSDGKGVPTSTRGALLRFMIIGPLLASPPETGELQTEIQKLADREWDNPTTGGKVKFSFSTIERSFYAARGDVLDPVHTLERKKRKDSGGQRAISVQLAEAIAVQFRDHRSWQYKLHYDNLMTVIEQNPEIGKLPSYSTINRYMKQKGMFKDKKRRKERKPFQLDPREKRSWEVQYTNQLWHLDFHEGSRSVLLTDGTRPKPQLIGILDDHSRLACHLQWYLDENAQNLIHGLCQAFQKRGIPRALMSDNGGAMKAAETRQGLSRVGVQHELTLPETPQQNGKQENFWTQIEQRLLPMLEGVPNLTLRLLNEATQAWVEGEYNRHTHSITGQAPIDRFLAQKNLGRTCPDSETLRRAFRVQETRVQRRSDGTISVEGKRFELPSRYRALRRVTVRFARWDLSSVGLMDPHLDTELCTLYPLDRLRNADQPRQALEPIADPSMRNIETPPKPCGIAPLLKQMMADYAATGLPPAYLPKDEGAHSNEVLP